VGLRVGQDGSGGEINLDRLTRTLLATVTTLPVLALRHRLSTKSLQVDKQPIPPVSRNYPLSRRQCHTHFGALFTIPRKRFTVGFFTKKHINSLYFSPHIQTKGRQALQFYLSAGFFVTTARCQAMRTHYVTLAQRCFSGRTKERLDASSHVHGTGPINSYCH
jgi:hypothetical protein